MKVPFSSSSSFKTASNTAEVFEPLLMVGAGGWETGLAATLWVMSGTTMFTGFAPNISDLSTFARGVLSDVSKEVTQGGKLGSVCCGKGAWIGFSSLGTGTWEPLLELARHWFQ